MKQMLHISINTLPTSDYLVPGCVRAWFANGKQ
jgi:hypothetical protein